MGERNSKPTFAEIQSYIEKRLEQIERDPGCAAFSSMDVTEGAGNRSEERRQERHQQRPEQHRGDLPRREKAG